MRFFKEGSRYATAVAIAIVCAGHARQGRADVIVAYESLNPTGGVPASEVGMGVQARLLDRGTGVTAASGSTFNTRDWSLGGVPEADDYIEWGWVSTPVPYDLMSLDIRYDRSSSGPAQIDIQLAVDGGVFQSVFVDPDVDPAGETQMAIDLSQFEAVSSAVFRLFGYSSSSSSGTFDLENFSTSPNRAILVSGEPAATVPEPAATTLIGSLVLCLAAGGGLRCYRSTARIRSTVAVPRI